MKILRLSTFDLAKCRTKKKEVDFIRGELEKAGFDMSRSYEVSQAINSFNYIFTQEEQTPLNL